MARRHDAPPDLVVEYRGERAVPDELCPGTLLQGYTSGSQLLCTTVQCDDGSTVLRLHGSVEFEICPDRRTVQAWNDPRCSIEMLGIFVVGHLLSTVLALRGETVLHASAVEIDGTAVAFVADSGIGKSTMAALACARGARFVTDDVLRLRECPDPGLWCWPGPTENRLRRDLTDISSTYHGTTTRTSADGRTVWSPRATNSRPLLSAPSSSPHRNGSRRIFEGSAPAPARDGARRTEPSPAEFTDGWTTASSPTRSAP